MGFGASVMGINLLNFANRQMDHLLVGYFLGATALGFYTVGYRLVRILLDLLPHALMPVALSAFARLQFEPPRLRAAFYEATRLMALVTFPAFAGLALVAPEMVPVLFGEKWLPSVPVLQALVPIGLLQSVTLLYPTVLKSIGRPGRALVLAAANVVVNAVAFSIAVHWGIVAVAAAYSIRGFVLWPAGWLMMRLSTEVALKPYLRAVGPALAGTGVMALVLVAMRMLAPPELVDQRLFFVGSVLLGASAYAITVCTTAPGLCRFARETLTRRSLVLREQGHEG
jgi:PST family polysaccharide transporter